jgi:hypothetical protein
MDMFANLRDFFSKELFADLTIYTFDSRTLRTSRVCHCHSLVLASALPKMKNMLLASSSGETTVDKLCIILEDANPGKVLSAISNLYDALAERITDYQLEQLREIFCKDLNPRTSSDLEEDCTNDVDDEWNEDLSNESPLLRHPITTLERLVESSITDLDFDIEFSAVLSEPYIQEIPKNYSLPFIQDDFFMLLEVGKR